MSAISFRALHECAVGHTYFLSSDTIATESTEVRHPLSRGSKLRPNRSNPSAKVQ